MAEQSEPATEPAETSDFLQPPAVRPPRKLSKPKITLKMPTIPPQITSFYNTPGGMVTIPLTPAAGLTPSYPMTVFQAYPNKAQEFMFKQFEGFKDFTKNTGKLGLSFGERFAFWCYGKAKGLSTNGFTHIFLLIIVCIYCALGGFIFFIFENEAREKLVVRHKLEDSAIFNQVTSNIFLSWTKSNITQQRNNIITEVSKLRDHYIKQYHLDRRNEGWGLINSMYFCGTIFTTIGRSFSDSDNEDNGSQRPLQKKHPPLKREEKSGYSSSKETSDADLSDDELDNVNWEKVIETDLRRRKGTRQTKLSSFEEVNIKQTQINDKDIHPDKVMDWEMVEQYGKESDMSLTTGNESSDDFWKSTSSTNLRLKDKSGKLKNKKEKSSTHVKLFQWNWFNILVNFRGEWKKFKMEHKKDMEIIRHQWNRCTIGLLIVVIFCGIGGMIFHFTEGAFEMFYKCGVKRVKRDFLDALWTKSHYMREEDWKSLARTKLMEFENQLYDAYEAGMTSYSGQKGWSFLNSVIYCITVITTIGYGHLAPVTTAGRVITIVYSIFGIPMFLILLADYGKLLTRIIKFLWAFVRRLYYTGSCRKVRKTAPVQEMVRGVQLVFDMTNFRKSNNSKECPQEQPFPCPTSPTGTPALSTYTIDDEFNLPISLAFAVLGLYMIGGAFLFSYLEDWSLFESFYFVYISTSTIGLGDFVPKGQVYILLCSLMYFVFGLSLTSMCINVVTEKLTDSFRQATAKISATMGFEITEDGLNNVAVTQNLEQPKEEPTD